MRTKGAKGGVKGNAINQDQFEKLAKMLCTGEEISAFFGVSYDTLNEWCKQNYEETFVKVIKRFNDVGRASLRRIQFKIAEKGNSSMAIFLGKQYLGQSDKQENTSLERVVIVSDMPQDDEEIDEA